MKHTRMFSFVAFMLITLSFCTILADDVLYARYPALSPDNQTIAFTYQGDIWTVPAVGGQATRLTVHSAEDILPQYSPDGRFIMFSSDRYNNFDVFITPSEGGTPKQLTYNSSWDVGSEWFPSGDSILFTSNRDGWKDIFKVSVNGGQPIKLTDCFNSQKYNGSLTPNGNYLIFNNGSGNSRWWRRDLNGSHNADIFIQDRSLTEFTSRRLTNTTNHEVWPILNHATNEIYYAACTKDWGQIWKISYDGGEPTQLTNFNGDGVQWLNSNPNGTMLVFEKDMKIFTLNPENNEIKQVKITIASDEKANLTKNRIFNGNVDNYALSPDNKKIAVVIHGDIFIATTDKPKIGFPVTTSPSRENSPVWGDDSRIVYFSSDQNGNYDIFSVDVITEVKKQLTDNIDNDIKPIISPDGTYLVFYRGMKQIIRYDLKSNKETVWVEGNFFDLGVEPTTEYDISPDSKWLVFTMGGPTYETDIHAVNLENKIYNLSRFAGWNYRPRFSSDGKQIYYTSNFERRSETYKIELTQPPVEFVESSFDSLFIENDKNDSAKSDETEKIEPVLIDISRIENRRKPAYSLSGSSTHPLLLKDGTKYFFISSIMGKSEIWSVDVDNDDGPNLKQLTHSGGAKSKLTMSDDDKIYYLEKGVVQCFDIAGAKSTPLKFKAEMEIDVQANLEQKYNETWQMLNSYFYDTTFHSTDWKLIREKYESAIPHIRTEIEFRNLMKEVMGELRASHLNYYINSPATDKQIKTGRLGIEFDNAHLDITGQYKIKSILPESPASIVGLKAEQYIININGTELNRETNMSILLSGTTDRRVILTVADKPKGKTSEIAVKPTSAGNIGNLRYDNWIEQRRQIVDSLSDNRLGYMHIRRMNQTSLDIFKQELVSVAENKDGVILDVRNNFGGSIAVHLLGMLVKTPYFLRNFRGFPTTSENKMRSKALEKPMNLLINNYSTSNAEIFAEGFRQLKLGKIIGMPTAGGVIGTSSYYLIDGTRIRRPSWGAYTIGMEDTDLVTRKPDIYIENLPDDYINGRDPQLVKAIEELLKEL